MGNICKAFDIDSYVVVDTIDLDDRIGKRFLRGGGAWGGSCFPKVVKVIIAKAKEHTYTPALLRAAVEVKDTQPEAMLELLEKQNPSRMSTSLSSIPHSNLARTTFGTPGQSMSSKNCCPRC